MYLLKNASHGETHFLTQSYVLRIGGWYGIISKTAINRGLGAIGGVMGEIVYRALCQMFTNYILAVVILPVALIFVANLVYIVIMCILEIVKQRKNR